MIITSLFELVAVELLLPRRRATRQLDLPQLIRLD
jgi:hypothetical protein